jgi:hypothetical protein
VTETFVLLLMAHCLADYPLQGDFLSKAKNPKAPIPGVPWYQAMTAHAMIQGGFVYIIMGSLLLGMLEVVAHFVIDYAKCQGWLSFNQDQGLHIACKAVWITLALTLPTL